MCICRVYYTHIIFLSDGSLEQWHTVTQLISNTSFTLNLRMCVFDLHNKFYLVSMQNLSEQNILMQFIFEIVEEFLL